MTMVNNFLKLVTDSEIEQIRDAAIKILCQEGVAIHNRYILELCEAKGIKVDYPRQKIQVTPEIWTKLEERFLASAAGPSSELIARRYNNGRYDKANEPEVIRRKIPEGFILGRDIPSIYDFKEGKKRLATLADNNEMVKALHMLPEVKALAPMFVSNDLDPLIEPVISLANAFKLSDKPFAELALILPGVVKYIDELHSIKEDKEIKCKHYFASMTRFTLDKNASGILEEIHKSNGIEIWGTNSVPILGLNCPVTIAGAAAVGLAEMIGGCIPAWVLNEDIALCAVPVSASCDMKTTRVLFSSPEATLTDAVLYQIFNTLYNMNVHTENSATYIDGKVPGLQAVHDKVYKSMTLFAYTGCDVGSHYGMLESGASICPAQMMLDFDLNGNMFKTVHGVEVNTDTLALELIEEIGVNGSFFETDHTFEHFRDLWNPKLMDRSSYASDEEEKAIEAEVLQAAQAKYDDAVNRYVPPQIDDARIKAYDSVVEKAKKELSL